MAKRRGRRGSRGAAPSESDSVGRTGAALPEQDVEPIRPEYSFPAQPTPAAPAVHARAQDRAQPPATPSNPELPDQKRASRRRRRRGRGGAKAVATPSAAAATMAERLPDAAEVVPHDPAEPGSSQPVAAERTAQHVAIAASDFAPEIQPQTPAPPVSKRPPRGVVVLAIGLPGSGKSTWFKRRGVTPLSSDLLRTVLFDDITEQRYQHLVFSTLRSILRARLIAHMPWNYLDATNLSPKERRQWIHMAREFGYEVHAVFFEVPLEVCLERNQRRQRIVPEEIMRDMAAKLRPPKFEEGFAKITVVRVKQSEEGAS